MRISATYGEWFDRVEVDGKVLDPKPSQKVRNHSPDGFSWGYNGSGPAQLALAILLKAGVCSEAAVHWHQEFKREVIAVQPQRGDWEIFIDPVKWVESKEHSEPHVVGTVAPTDENDPAGRFH